MVSIDVWDTLMIYDDIYVGCQLIVIMDWTKRIELSLIKPK